MAGMHHADEAKTSSSASSDRVDGVNDGLKTLSVSTSSKSQKKSGGLAKKKQTGSIISKPKSKQIQRPSSQSSYRDRKYESSFKRSDPNSPTKRTPNRLSSSDPSGDALLRRSISGDQLKGVRHSSSSSPSQSSDITKYSIAKGRGRRGSDSCPEKGYILPYGLRVQHAAHKCMWSGSESGSAISPAGSGYQPSSEFLMEDIGAAGTSTIPTELRKGPDCQFHVPQKKQIPKKPKKDFKFDAYMPLCEVQQSLKKGELIEGVLRINPRNYEDAYISAPDGQMDIYIGGIHDRNRALNGDVVAVQLKEPKEWKIFWDELRDFEKIQGCKIIESIDNSEKDENKIIKTLSFDNITNFEVPVDSDSVNKLETENSNTMFNRNDLFTQNVESTSSNKKKKRRNKGRKYKKKLNEQNEFTQTHKINEDLENDAEHYETLIDTDRIPEKQANVGNYILPKENFPNELNFSSSLSTLNSVQSSDLKEVIFCDEHLRNAAKDSEEQEITTDNASSQPNHQWEIEDSFSNNKLIVIPDDILHFASCDDKLSCSVDNNVIEEEENLTKSGSIAVAPDELSGEEFSQSVSGDSTCSHHLDDIQEDTAFIECQQDAINNNIMENDVAFVAIDEVQSDKDQIEKKETNNVSNSENEICSKSVNSPNDKSETFNSDINYSLNSLDTVLPLNNSTTSSNKLECQNSKYQFDKSKQTCFQSESGNTNRTAVRSSESLECSSKTVNNSSEKYQKQNKRKLKARKVHLPQNEGLNETDSKILNITKLMMHPKGLQFIQKTAKVVHILEKKHTRVAAGFLKLMQNRNSKWALFSPTDHRLPRMFIPMRECPTDFVARPNDFSKYLFLAHLVEWTEDSKFAKGKLTQKLGEAGEVEVETLGILMENGIDTKDFSDDVLSDISQYTDWKIPSEEAKIRRDFRDECVFTIDPLTARDLDDAVSCRQLDDGTFEIGVHIADVTYFVKEKTNLNAVASERATSVYLVQKVIPMLPRILCEKLCSLNPGEDRLTFSVVWKMTKEGEIISEWFGRSIICSCVKLHYEQAQEMIEKAEKDEIQLSEIPHIYGKHTVQDVTQRVILLNKLAKELRKKRFEYGALRLDQIKLQFVLDRESGLPSGFSVFEQTDSNRLIEEFMLLANMSVAHKIYKAFPERALLRCHPPPDSKMMNDVVTICGAMGIALDATSSGSLQASLLAMFGEDAYSKARTQILTSLCSKPMKCALYFSSGHVDDPDLYHHYALSVPLYTHFTSPIRRYPDIIVHRLLAEALGYSPPSNSDPKCLQKIAEHCNDMKYTAKRVNELSSDLFLLIFIKECGPLEDEEAMVMAVMDHSFDVLILRIGVVKRVYCDKLNLKGKQYTKCNKVSQLTLFWNEEVELVQEIKIFTLVNVILSVSRDDPTKFNVILKQPDVLRAN